MPPRNRQSIESSHGTLPYRSWSFVPTIECHENVPVGFKNGDRRK
jgi:hypothetical protein